MYQFGFKISFLMVSLTEVYSRDWSHKSIVSGLGICFRAVNLHIEPPELNYSLLPTTVMTLQNPSVSLSPSKIISQLGALIMTSHKTMRGLE